MALQPKNRILQMIPSYMPLTPWSNLSREANCPLDQENLCVGFEALTEVVMNSYLLWNITPYGPFEVN
jgi:hypothetical protein